MTAAAGAATVTAQRGWNCGPCGGSENPAGSGCPWAATAGTAGGTAGGAGGIGGGGGG